MIVGISGLAGSGKDTYADFLVEHHGFVKVSLADEIKRTAQRWWPAFTEEHLWGASDARNQPVEVAPGVLLTARRACQQIGTEVARAVDPDVWVRFTLNVAKRLAEGGCYYNRLFGLRSMSDVSGVMTSKKNVVIPDCRFENELNAIRKKEGTLVRITRPSAGLDGEQGQHRSETEQAGISDDAFDFVYVNEHSLGMLENHAASLADRLLGRLIPYDEKQKDIPPFKRD